MKNIIYLFIFISTFSLFSEDIILEQSNLAYNLSLAYADQWDDYCTFRRNFEIISSDIWNINLTNEKVYFSDGSFFFLGELFLGHAYPVDSYLIKPILFIDTEEMILEFSRIHNKNSQPLKFYFIKAEDFWTLVKIEYWEGAYIEDESKIKEEVFGWIFQTMDNLYRYDSNEFTIPLVDILTKYEN